MSRTFVQSALIKPVAPPAIAISLRVPREVVGEGDYRPETAPSDGLDVHWGPPAFFE